MRTEFSADELKKIEARWPTELDRTLRICVRDVGVPDPAGFCALRPVLSDSQMMVVFPRLRHDFARDKRITLYAPIPLCSVPIP